MEHVFTKDNFNVCSSHGMYVVINTNKEFENGHTHINTYKQACYLVDCAIKHKIPKRCNTYFLVSLKRISTDKHFIEKLERRIEGKYKEKYHNKPVHNRR